MPSEHDQLISHSTQLKGLWMLLFFMISFAGWYIPFAEARYDRLKGEGSNTLAIVTTIEINLKSLMESNGVKYIERTK